MSQKLLPYEERAFNHQRRKELFHLHTRKNMKKDKRHQVKTAYRNKSNDIMIINAHMFDEDEQVVFLKPGHSDSNTYNHRNKVRNTFKKKTYRIATKGVIIDVIPFGETIQMEEPVYTILVEEENLIYKFIRESNIIKFI